MSPSLRRAAGGAAALALIAACYDFDASLARCKAPGGACTVPPVLTPDPDCVPTAVDAPDDAFADTDCDGVDGAVDAALFVDPVDGDDLAAGTPEAPMRTLSAALQRAQGAGKRALYLGAGRFGEGELTVAQPIALHGGYAGRAGGWRRDARFTTLLEGGATAVTVRDVSAPVLLDHLLVSSSQPTLPGTASVALRVLRATDVTVHGTLLSAGPGSEGAAGAAGALQPAGSPGVEGGTGSPAAAEGEGGSGPQQACAGDDVGGGNGGRGGAAQPPLAGAPGRWQGQEVTSGGKEGTSRTVVSSDNSLCTGGIVIPRKCACSGGKGEDGLPGEQGEAGLAGAEGTGSGLLVGDSWQAERAESGQVGTAGAGGGGGGGGGVCTPPAPAQPGGGGGGGQGGAGGCGGLGGEGGQGGGASIALLVVDAQVSLSDTTLRTADGGAGGAGGGGGEGGGGGPGSEGGPGSKRVSEAENATFTTTGGTGGRGGAGGKGGGGGAGGGGAGGPSVAVWCDAEARLTRTGRLLLQLGQGGPGGASAGNPGRDGLSLEAVGCSL